jgi:hypothetical protein
MQGINGGFVLRQGVQVGALGRVCGQIPQAAVHTEPVSCGLGRTLSTGGRTALGSGQMERGQMERGQMERGQYGVWCMVYGVWCMVYGAWCSHASDL